MKCIVPRPGSHRAPRPPSRESGCKLYSCDFNCPEGKYSLIKSKVRLVEEQPCLVPGAAPAGPLVGLPPPVGL
ncbi:hypothetical protein E2C01_077271 [Portunus trituberculatus]|uniref:Uncharacterized protein n=1 Tax=Portunus trituberculatus TaxID=210409 RepID=A0A5B7ILK9_PORTR|nr:hypothetical protein [Portunus trituberculatus]